ncbi:hypothetical protein K435DRAFT_773718 [Dendrothele bispora CBS 962.96]|uniref:RING-type domain-containing protein n=1 Tax=Dendrothele bispora (strain CBS 962.96) TaxID=1314807 RepID=A0A4S8MR32_DENBC|nr:hypothetical protein K435DRAFT_773718 [Dendrothele bispora CBS 962.96]
MPRASRSSTSAATTRRSSRLNSQASLNTSATGKKYDLSDISAPRRRRLTNNKTSNLESSSASTSVSCHSDELHLLDKENDAGDDTKSTLRRSSRITPAELLRREKALLRKEQEFKARVEELDNRTQFISKREDEVNALLAQAAEREAEATLSQLEEHFTCSLCYEILAHPYSLNPGPCGHTFCALCILKWFFSRCHSLCGGWHESVDCPLCRSLLVITPDHTPRLDVTFPFVPNRTAATLCESLVGRLLDRSGAACKMTVKREESEGVWSAGVDCGVKKRKFEEVDMLEAESLDGLSEWQEGGTLRSEWLRREREGKKEMNHLLEHWTDMQAKDFAEMKHRLGV